MGEAGETILGVIPVEVRLSLGTERLRLFLTNKRFIVAHIGKRGAGALAGAFLLGKFSDSLENLAKAGKELGKVQSVEALGPQEILEADRDNFSIGYETIAKVQLDQQSDRVMITVVTEREKLQFSTLADFQSATGLFREALGNRVSIGRIEDQ